MMDCEDKKHTEEIELVTVFLFLTTNHKNFSDANFQFLVQVSLDSISLDAKTCLQCFIS